MSSLFYRALRASGLCIVLGVVTLAAGGCGKNDTRVGPKTAAPVHKHEHRAPHGGTAVVLGEEVYHLELVLDSAAGKLSAYVLDGEMENFIRVAAPSFEVVATVGGVPQPLVFKAVADSATGETVGDTALFETQAEWLKTTTRFDATLTKLEIRGTVFSGVAFNFPRGNDKE